ncbi:uncharacterized protein LOC133723445 isoform X2 [Rosa rugosa]|uniref:uncharacterized protein LOC133723445 isoform X2 n=1 Tax=Rosa rugosa TaxID=74645 RepID=UPI002B405DE0|nr:uncharacterized protein LOC133723445 isoform X2 [Rosa rugosa]
MKVLFAERVILAHQSGLEASQPALTQYRVLGPTMNECSWIELQPLTSQKHQVLNINWFQEATKWERLESVNFRMAEESFMDRLGTYMHESCPKIDKDCWQANCNEPFPDSLVFVVHGSDESTPVEDAFEFGKIIPDH